MRGSLQEDLEGVRSSLVEEHAVLEGKTVLVTGGAGFLGSWVCDLLLSLGNRVLCLDNLSSGLRSNLSHLEKEEGFRFLEGDVSRPFAVDEKVDAVFHMASRASPFEFEEYPLEILKANTLGTLYALEFAHRSEARFLFTSTSEVYGDPDPRFVPTPETYNGNVNPTGPRGCYDESKRAGEAYVLAYVRQHGLDARIVRIFNTYGPRMRSDGIYGRVVPRFVDQALSGEPITVFGDGSQTRSFTYVTDEVEGILRAAFREGLHGQVINIGNDQETTVLALAELVKEISRSPSEIVFRPLPKDDPRRRCPDISRAKELLGWRPRVSLREGLEKTLRWFRERG
jgi:UDP-glucuronate decarboxylase